MRNFALHAGILAAIVLTAPGLRNGFLLGAEPAPVGKAEAGKTFWQAQMCQYCHALRPKALGGRTLPAADSPKHRSGTRSASPMA
jgi:hypothetical protein